MLTFCLRKENAKRNGKKKIVTIEKSNYIKAKGLLVSWQQQREKRKLLN